MIPDLDALLAMPSNDAEMAMLARRVVPDLMTRMAELDKENEEQHTRWCNEVVDHCPHDTDAAVCCSECLAAALKAKRDAITARDNAEREQRDTASDFERVCGERDRLADALEGMLRTYDGEGTQDPDEIGIARAALRLARRLP